MKCVVFFLQCVNVEFFSDWMHIFYGSTTKDVGLCFLTAINSGDIFKCISMND